MISSFNIFSCQLKCYALGALDTFGDLYDIRRIKLSIYQPRRENTDTFEMSVEEILKWADEVLSPRARLAYEGNGDFSAGEHCRFCRIKATCRKRAAYSLEFFRRLTLLFPGLMTSKPMPLSELFPVHPIRDSSW